jgi:subtilase family serine protease
MDYQQRLDQQQRAEADKIKASPLPPSETASIGFDYIVLAVLAGSTAGLLVISRMRRRPRRARRYPPYYQPR